jgi:predicted RND superfamily exporter protein
MTLALRLIQLLLRHRLVAGLLILISVAASAYAARSIEVRFAWRDFYEYEGNPRLPLLSRYTEEFGDPAGFVVLLIQGTQGNDIFDVQVLKYVDAVTRKLETLEQFQKVRSLTNASAIRASGDDVESGPLLRHLPETAEEMQRLRDVALGSSLLLRRLVAPDGSATAVLAEIRTPAAFATIAELRDAVTAAARVMKSVDPPPGVRIEVTGAPVVEVEVTRALVDDQMVLTPVVLAILVAALALTFRSIHGMLLPLAAVSVSLVWTAGVFSVLGRAIDIFGSTFPTILLVYGVVDPIFVYTRYLDKLALSRTTEQAVLEAMRELLLPCFLTSLTTALGFAAFATATLPMIKYFGIVVAIGVLFSFVTTVTVLPLLLVSVSPSHLNSNDPWISQATHSLMHWLWDVTKRRRELVVGLALSLLIIGAGAAHGVGIVTEYVGALPNGRVKEGIHTLEQKLSGVVRLAVYLEGEPDSLKRPDVLRAIEKLDRFAEQQPLVTSSISLADLVADTNRAFQGGDPREQLVPDSEPLISQYLALVDPADLSDFVNSDYSRSHIRILVSDRGSQALWQLRDALQHEMDALFPGVGVRATLTGAGLAAYYAADEVVVEVLWGFLVAFGVILVIQLVIFRSLRVALISVVPNLVPVCICFLLMRALGLNLRVDNSLVLCVSVGGLFNTTIHIVARVMQQLRAGASEPDLIVGRALAAVGPPSLYTAAILSLGFSAMGLSRFPGLQSLGFLCLVTLMTGFAADATMTTTFFRMFFNWGAAEGRSKVSTPALHVDSLMAPDEEGLR